MTFSRIKSHLDELKLTVTLAGHVRVPLDWRHDRHITANNCLYLFLEGEGELSIDDRSFRPLPGEVYLLPAGATISYSTSETNPFRQMFCHFHAFCGAVPLFRLFRAPPRIRLDDPGRAEEPFARLIEAFQSDDEWALLAVQAYMYELLRTLWEEPRDHPRFAPSARHERANEIAAFMEKHSAGPLSVEEIASVFGYNPKYFFRYFKSAFGTTPHQYLAKLKLERAKQLLLTTDWSVGRIAEELGMERSHFARVFLRHTEMTPAKFRDWMRGGV